MKKIINGSKYDTTTAKEVGTLTENEDNDYDYVTETLYRTKSGKYFLHCRGGAATIYARQTSYNNFIDGERITPVSVDEAKEWAEKALDGDDYERAFGEVTEDTTLISAEISIKLKEKLDRKKKELKMTTAELVCKMIEDL